VGCIKPLRSTSAFPRTHTPINNIGTETQHVRTMATTTPRMSRIMLVGVSLRVMLSMVVSSSGLHAFVRWQFMG
jgi:hypothetical protein